LTTPSRSRRSRLSRRWLLHIDDPLEQHHGRQAGTGDEVFPCLWRKDARPCGG
jgi:hypothetical protein